MRSMRIKAVLLLVTAVSALGLITLGVAIGPRSSGAQQGAAHNCPEASKWAISVWEGPDGTDVEQALATCGEDGVLAAYRLSPESGSWFRWFAGWPELSTLATLDNLQGVTTLGGVGASPPSSVSSSFQQEDMHDCPKHGRWAISVWPGANGTPIEQALTTCADVWVSAAYHLDPHTQGWHRWFLAYPERSTLATLDHMQAVLAWAAPAPSPTPTPSPAPTPGGEQVTATGSFTNLNAPVGEWYRKDNTITLRFNTAGGPVTGEGRIEDYHPTDQWSYISEYQFDGTYSADTGQFEGTYQETWRAGEAEPLVFHGPWRASLVDGHITGIVEESWEFELTVQG